MSRLSPIRVVDVELSRGVAGLEGLDGYLGVKAIVRLHGVPIGYVNAAVSNGRCSAATLARRILDGHSRGILDALVATGLAAPDRDAATLRLEDLLELAPPLAADTELPRVTVAVCTRDRAGDLAICLEALVQLDYPHLDLLVVDNAPTDDATRRVVERHPSVRYVAEPRPGLDWARNRAILEARGEIVAYTDDDVVVDSGWARALGMLFARNPEVMAATGLVVPFELETDAQVLFEVYGGFGRGFARRWMRVPAGQRVPWGLLGTGQFGTGANMAFRRSLFESVGYFDPALDVGTVTNGGGDLEMFFRTIVCGHTLVYEPRAMVRHRHRRDYARLRTQLANNGIGLYAYFTRCARAYPSTRRACLRLGTWWLYWWHLRRLWQSLKLPTLFPRDLVLAELRGIPHGLVRYRVACRRAAEIGREFGPQGWESRSFPGAADQRAAAVPADGRVAVRRVDLSAQPTDIEGLEGYARVRLFFAWGDRTLGTVDVENDGRPVRADRVLDLAVSTLGARLLDPEGLREPGSLHAVLERRYGGADTAPAGLPPDVPVSVIVATCDRPDDLRACLRSLVAQRTPRPLQIIVVDNRPASGLAAPVVAEFPGVQLVCETRAGSSYARNAGILASSGAIVVTTDDDVVAPPGWIERLVAPFARADVAAVTGNVLPLELETEAQRLFEEYGGLSRGFEPLEVGSEWFESFGRTAVPTWQLGATANAAFRAEVLADPRVGLMHEALGAGVPTGCSEDTLLFFRILKQGYRTIAYEPAAFVWHGHRRTAQAFRRQIYAYSKGHVAYHLVTLFEDGDLRALWYLLVSLPKAHAWRVYARLRGWSAYPVRLMLLEVLGNLAGPWALWRSLRQVRRQGRSAALSAPRPSTTAAAAVRG
jgi:GT2 family glycosyltransferase